MYLYMFSSIEDLLQYFATYLHVLYAHLQAFARVFRWIRHNLFLSNKQHRVTDILQWYSLHSVYVLLQGHVKCKEYHFLKFWIEINVTNWSAIMSGQGFMDRLRQFDAYPKTLEDFRVKTFGGAAGT